MGDNDHWTTPRRHLQPRQRRGHTRNHLRKALALRRGNLSEFRPRQGPKVGQILIGQALMRAEILFPEPSVLLRHQFRPERLRRLPTAQRRATDQSRRLSQGASHVRSGLRVDPGGDISPSRKPPARVGWGVPNNGQFVGFEWLHLTFQGRADVVCHEAMRMSILITGGARSGKSALAERMTLSLAQNVIYVATAQAFDAEMATRIGEHQARRGPEWQTVQSPRALLRTLQDTDHAPRLVDCLTLWLSNLILAEQDWRAEVDALASFLPNLQAPVVFVTNEVGSGIVPENALARQFRDAAGWTNQRLGAACQEVWLCVAGQPLKIKPHGA